MSAHTPGPWNASCVGYGSQIKPDIAWIGYGSSYPKEVHKANAHLIAAAPDLLDALQRMMDRYDDEYNCMAAENKAAWKAIARATINFDREGKL